MRFTKVNLINSDQQQNDSCKIHTGEFNRICFLFQHVVIITVIHLWMSIEQNIHYREHEHPWKSNRRPTAIMTINQDDQYYRKGSILFEQEFWWMIWWTWTWKIMYVTAWMSTRITSRLHWIVSMDTCWYLYCFKCRNVFFPIIL